MIEQPFPMPIRHEADRTIEEFDLPRLIDTPYPSISIGDLRDIGDRFVPGIDPQVFSALEAQLHELKQMFAPTSVETSFYYTSSENLGTPLEEIAAKEVARADRNVGVVHLDKFIGSDQDGPMFFRLNVSRDPDNNLVARTGTQESPEEQFDALIKWSRENALEELLFIDDVVAFGNTFPPLINELREQLSDIKFRIFAGIAASGGTWRGIEKIREKTGIDVEYLTKACVSPEIKGGPSGLAIPVSRDLTIFGGKTSRNEDGVDLSYPYFLPFSKPLPGLIASEMRIESAMALHDFSSLYCDVLQAKLGREITINDLTENGSGVPMSSLECLQDKMELPSPQTTLQEYLRYTHEILEENLEEILKECD